MKSLCWLFLFLLIKISGHCQEFTQTIYGTVVMKSSLTPLRGVSIFIVNADPAIAAITSTDGSFVLKNVPVGRQSLKITHTGFYENIIDNILITSGKQVYLEITMEESSEILKGVVVKSGVDKKRPLNPMTLAGGRMFSIEETQKFAASVNDPSRMITSFPGVVQVNDGDNSIAIRGNSPNGLLWRLEGVDIPNPNHFASVGTSGGGISILSAQVLSNSDFLNGAFNAEYGNALSGVFDLKLRKGNNQKREFTLQAGLIGVDVSSEGPLKKGYKGSYLVNYRYSTLQFIQSLGIDLGENSKFQDLSFNINLPTSGHGNFSIFGLGGISSQHEDRTLFDIINNSGFIRFRDMNTSNTGILGVSHFKIINDKINIKSSVALTGFKIAYSKDSSHGSPNLVAIEKKNYIEKRISASSVANIRTGKDNVLRTGVTAALLNYSLTEGESGAGSTEIINKIRESGSTFLMNSFAEYLMRIGSRLSVNTGIHFSFLALNQSTAVEPRVAIKYDLSAKHSVSLGYGLHSQLQPIGVYFFRIKNPNGTIETPNHDLGFSKAHHVVGSWNFIIDRYHKIKLETYYQHLFNIPVSPDTANKTSILNVTEGYLAEKLVNKGLGKNYGIELTIERFLKNNFYYVLSASVFESKYKAADRVWRNTRFNGNYTFSATGGNEIAINKNKSSIGINIKAVYLGGLRTTPIDMEASKASGTAVYFSNRSFEKKLADYSRIDIRISYRKNYRHFTLTTSLDIQNMLDKENIEKEFYDPSARQIDYKTQNGLTPVLSFRAEF